MDVPGLRRYALEEIRRFEEQARSSGVSERDRPGRTLRAVRRPRRSGPVDARGGHQSEWAQHPLLVALHREAWGGEKFFEMLDRISQDPARYIDLMELQYLVHRVRLRRQVPGAGARARAPARSAAATSIARFAIIAARPSPSCRCGGAGWRIGAIRSFGTCRGGSSARRRCRSSPSRSLSTTPASRSLADPVHAELAKVGLEDFVATASRPRR